MAELHCGPGKKFLVDAGSPRLSACFEKKESAIEYARQVARMQGTRPRVFQLSGALSGARRKRRRR